MSDIALDSSGDIDLTEGKISLVNTVQSLTAQRITIKLRTYKGEWYLDLSQGVPYFQQIFKKSSNSKALADTILKGVISSDEDVVSLNSFESSLSSSGNYSCTFNVTTSSGAITTIEQNIQI